MDLELTTLKVHKQHAVLNIQFYRPEHNNSINRQLVREVTYAVTQAEGDTDIKVIVLSGLKDNFCTGMDFKAISDGNTDGLTIEDSNRYYEMLKLFSTCSKVVIAKIEGKVNAGGIGIVAASDIAIADEGATFALSEALFGLLPACVLPFLIRRIGYQKAQWLTLTTQAISANRAYEIGLIDELTTDVTDNVRRNALRLTKLQPDIIRDLKNYMSHLWIMNDKTQELAVTKITALVNSELVQSNIKNFIQKSKFPWDR